MNKTVSVIITTYNRDFEILERAIKSVLNQTYKNFELIVIDDNSDVKYDIENKIKKYKEITYYRNPINSGVSVARNKGLELAKGKYISFLDDDDEWTIDKLEKQISILEKSDSDVGIVYSNFYKYYDADNKKVENNILKVNGNGLNTILEIGNYIMFPIIKKECFDKVGKYDQNIFRSEDYEMYLRILTKYKIVYVDELLAIYHINSNNKSSNKTEFIKANIAIETKHNDLLNKYPLGRYNVLLSRAKAYAHTKKPKEAFATYFKALKYGNIKKMKTSILTFGYIVYLIVK